MPVASFFMKNMRLEVREDVTKSYRFLRFFDYKIPSEFSAQNDMTKYNIPNYSAVRHKQESLSFPTTF